MFIPEGAPLTLHNMASALFQVAGMKGMTATAVRAVRAVAFMMERLEMEAISEQARDIAVEKAGYISEELKNMMEHIKTQLAEEVEKHIATLTEVTSKIQSNITWNQAQDNTDSPTPATT
ncbi:hypothetical protein CVT25_000253 [Psilocybe cyanescens]|uniref:SMARCC C-terminal domain-containing protein n=1 Tax=Psilocybe cyanescens TaxID=93625 RepID=A0A409W2Y0_PSICY|nr:hypothetical protein CVT25_000253 [Psilocybe cyanescens]